MALGACGYNCGKPFTGNEVDFPHNESGIALCSKVHPDCLETEATNKLWNKTILLCPSCRQEGNAHNRIPLKQRTLARIYHNPKKFIAGACAGGYLIFGIPTLVVCLTVFQKTMTVGQVLAVTNGIGTIGGIAGFGTGLEIDGKAKENAPLRQPLLHV